MSALIERPRPRGITLSSSNIVHTLRTGIIPHFHFEGCTRIFQRYPSSVFMLVRAKAEAMDFSARQFL